ncbi:hypothetical protein THAOC_04423, partial [Thalassiosira oceanica]
TKNDRAVATNAALGQGDSFDEVFKNYIATNPGGHPLSRSQKVNRLDALEKTGLLTPGTIKSLRDLTSSANKSTSVKRRKAPKKAPCSAKPFPAALTSNAKLTMTRELPPETRPDLASSAHKSTNPAKRRKAPKKVAPANKMDVLGGMSLPPSGAGAVSPVVRVTLELLGGNYTFVLVPSGQSHTTPTSLGLYSRSEMTIMRSDGGELSGLGSALPPNTGVVARVRFGRSTTSPGGGKVELRIDSLGLPTLAHSGCPASHDAVGIKLLPENSFPQRQWRQLGKTDGRTVVLQLGFRRLSCGTVPAGETCVWGYTLAQAFFSQPIL